MAQLQAVTRRFDEIAAAHLGGTAPLEELRLALRSLGADGHRSIDELPPYKRAELVDRLVRSLTSLPVAVATVQHHGLLAAVDAAPRGEWRVELGSPVSLVELRNHVKYVLTAQGLPWSAISRLQAGICGLGRWIVSEGGGEALVAIEAGAIRFVLTMTASGLGDTLIEHSPISSAVKSAVEGFRIAHAGPQIRFEFIVRG